ncbi:MAG: class A beta-lactamase-related serine hydrolase [Nitrospiraceae bacterium]|nr:class A beta-lactamase-related serine hydrolase [Nitrospiraceae bacterium]
MNNLRAFRLPVKIGIALLLVALFAGGYGTRMLTEPAEPVHSQIRLKGYRFIHPLLECEVPHLTDTVHPDIDPLRDAVQDVVDEHVKDRSAQVIAVYFRDLTSGAWFGINDRERFTPASLMKVPLMIAVLKRSEGKPEYLLRELRYTGGLDLREFQHVPPAEVLQKGASYTIDDLLYRMIAYSDNDAAMLLARAHGGALLAGTFADLQLPFREGVGEEFIDVRSFSAFFRVLFNASYLSHGSSERALGYLSRSPYADGIRSGLPQGVSVASKFGEFSAGSYQLHEFGVVYYPDHPYLLGIVTKGGTPVSLPHVLQELSKAIYGELERQHREQSKTP